MDKKVIATCIDYTHDGKGVVKIDKMPIFVDNLLIGEEAEILITKKNKSYYLGKVSKLLKVSLNRVKPICPNYKICGGCHIMHMTYDEQLRFKAARVREVIKRIGGVEVDTPLITGMENPYRYRNKVQVPIGETYDGHIVAGFYHPKSHQIIDMEECFIENKDADNLVLTIKKLVKKYNIEPCDIYHNIGVLRYVIIRKSMDNNDILVVFVTRNNTFPKSSSFINELVSKCPNIKTVVQNVNPKNTSVVLGNYEKVLYGDGYIFDKINGLTFKISAHSFYQVNPLQTEILYSKAIEFANLSKKETVLDAYCGVGTIGLIASKKAKFVKGVELVESAIKDAKENAKANNISNASFVCADATDFILEEAKRKKTYDVMFLDPPRDGCSDKFIKSVLKMEPKKIVYVSCDPSSLARDLKQLKSKYILEKLECVDMFPQTYHVETICLLVKK